MLKVYNFIFSVLFVLNFHTESGAQGCVAIRQMGGLSGSCTGTMYNLQKGDIQVGAAYRYFHSWRHFIGTEEQEHRQTTGGGTDANGNQLGNAVNIYSHAADLNLSYGLNHRIQLNATIPYVHNERSQVLRTTTTPRDTFRYSVYAQGLADIRFSANYWVFNPMTAHKGNIQLGLGIKTASGSHSVTDIAPQADGTTKEVTMDQAIQPGDGGVGFSVELQAFRQLYKGLSGFVSGFYLFNPKESNGSFRSAPKPGLDGYNIYACPDQYLARAGVAYSFGKAQNLSLSLAGRFEGIPAYDVFGGQVAYRRPGYVGAIESGLSYRLGKHTFGLFVPANFIRNRIQSAADIADQTLQNAQITDATKFVHVQGDAAFADYSLNFTYSCRLANLFHKKEMKMDVPKFQDVKH